MAMHLIDRPGIDVLDSQHRGLGAITSVALHGVALLGLIAAFRLGPGAPVSQTDQRLIPQHLVWVPHDPGGGGKAAGGDRSTGPVRRVKQAGTDASSVPAETTPSTDIAPPPPTELTAIPAMPMADATQPLAGTIDGDPSARSAGPGSSGAGDAIGDSRGSGNGQGESFGDGVHRGGPGVTMPAVIESVSPRYTVDAMRARVQGSVWIECVVLRDGSVGDARVMRSLDSRFGLDAAAVAAAKRWRFRPGRLNGQPVPVIVTIELTFSVR